MSSYRPTDGEHMLHQFATRLREVAGGGVPIPRHVLALAASDSGEYGNAALMWNMAMSGTIRGSPVQPSKVPAGRTISVCMNCYVGHDNAEEGDRAVVQHLCRTCGLHDHVILRIVGAPRVGGPRIQPIAKLSMEDVSQGVRAPAPRAPAGPEGLISARSAVRAGSAAAGILGREFWDHPLTDGEELFYNLFDGRPDPSAPAPYVEVDKKKYAARFRIGDAEVPLLKAHKFFADSMNAVSGQRPTHLDSGRRIRLNARIGEGTYGMVYSVSPAKGERRYAVKVIIALACRTVDDPKSRHPIIDIDPVGFPLHMEYVMGTALARINGARPAGTPELNLVLPHCIFGIAIPGGWGDSGRGGAKDLAVAVCIVMPQMAMDVQTAVSRVNIRDRRVVFLRNLLRSVATTLHEVHAAGFTHADIKTENLLIQNAPITDSFLPEEAVNAKLCDYSLSAFGEASYLCMSPDYRAPEVWLGMTWGPAIDIWGLGCVAMEVLLKDRLHVDAEPKCETMEDYVGRIAECFGPYPTEMYKAIRANNGATAADIRAAVSAPISMRRGLNGLLEPRNAIEHELTDLIGKMLVIDPAARYTAAEVLAHPFLSGRA